MPDFQTLVITYIITLVLCMVIELLWLGVIGKKFVDRELGHLLGKTNWYAVAIFYPIYALALMVFAIYPNLAQASISTAGIMGAVFGFFAYMTYELTNLSTLKDWPLRFTIVDIVWGTILSGSVCALTMFLYGLVVG